MKFKLSSFILFIAVFLLFPLQGLAVEYSITDVTIDAFIQTDGTVEVIEKHTYEFEGEFNGITRSIIPKEGSSITDFSASENEKSLRVEKEDDMYKIYRKGEDETVTTALTYKIEKGVEVYRDVVQFYWPFFDNRNDSTYENMIITIHPPESTKEVVAFGYDAAFGKESVQPDGSVVFHLGEVPSSTNGDIRVAYDTSLFAVGYQTADKDMRAEIIAAKNKLLTEAKEKAESREKLSNFAGIVIPLFAIILLFFIIRNWIEARAKLAAIKREVGSTSFLPKQVMSLPATILYTNHNYLPPQAMAAALLDLVRKGLVQQTSNESFKLFNRTGALEHEEILIDRLFDKIGQNCEFSFEDLEAYTKDKKNHEIYSLFQSAWANAVRKEVKEHSFYENKNKYRLAIGMLSIPLSPLLILFPMYDLFGWFVMTIFLFLAFIIYAIAYRPRTFEGAKLSYEWLIFKGKYKLLKPEDWKNWSEDDQMRAYIYALGTSDKDMQKQNDRLVSAFSKPYTGTDDFQPYSIYSFGYVGPTASGRFHSANDSTSSTGGGSAGSSGGGTGGGGGGSGAF
ncbi:DUF2207 domain-containing protein [Fredinandcohnia sp. 179-A 10B2 NHS]|uniref:DUF2207 domain-containing protein n=1 Tax=Fredinandcohnia sp. 179-A 10B2 NHS TaxID=3235176 RepID=UPI00399FC1AA